MADKTKVSNADSYFAIGSYWDEHDATEFGEESEVRFDININSQQRYFPLDNILFKKIKLIAKAHGVTEETLLNLWVQEKISQDNI